MHPLDNDRCCFLNNAVAAARFAQVVGFRWLWVVARVSARVVSLTAASWAGDNRGFVCTDHIGRAWRFCFGFAHFFLCFLRWLRAALILSRLVPGLFPVDGWLNSPRGARKLWSLISDASKIIWDRSGADRLRLSGSRWLSRLDWVALVMASIHQTASPKAGRRQGRIQPSRCPACRRPKRRHRRHAL